jgi:hypothetical protein
MIRYVFRLLPLSGTGTLSVTKTSTLGSPSPAEGGTDRWEKKNARCQNQTGLPNKPSAWSQVVKKEQRAPKSWNHCEAKVG